MEFENENQEITLPVQRKKRQLSEKQLQNFEKARQVRMKNIELRKQAKKRIDEVKKDQMIKNTNYDDENKLLQDLLTNLLISQNKIKNKKENKKESKKEIVEEQEPEPEDEEEPIEEEEEPIEEIKPQRPLGSVQKVRTYNKRTTRNQNIKNKSQNIQNNNSIFLEDNE